MSHNYKDLNPDDAKSFIPSNEEILERKVKWETFLGKYSNCDDNEDDGIDMNALSDEEGYGDKGEAVDQLSDGDSDVEDFVDNREQQVESYCTGSETFGSLPRDQQRERITLYVSPKLIEQLKAIVSRRMAELGRMNLPFWQVSRERVQTKMSHDEHYFESPAFRFGGKSGQSSMDLQRTISSSRGNPKLNLNNVTINGIPAMQCNNFAMSTSSNDLPSAIQSLCKMDMNFSLKITEREYDVQVQGRNLPDVLKKLNIPHPAGFSCIEPITISSDEEDSEQAGALEDFMNGIGIQLKLEPKDKTVAIVKDPKPKGKSGRPTKAQTMNASSMSQKLAEKFKPWIPDDEQSRDVDYADKNPVDGQSSVQKKPAVNKKKPISKTAEDESKNEQKKLEEAKKAEKEPKKKVDRPEKQKKGIKSKAMEFFKFPGDSSNEDEDDSCNPNQIAPKADQPPQKRPRDSKK